jgi:hypothetical protein
MLAYPTLTLITFQKFQLQMSSQQGLGDKDDKHSVYNTFFQKNNDKASNSI